MEFPTPALEIDEHITPAHKLQPGDLVNLAPTAAYLNTLTQEHAAIYAVFLTSDQYAEVELVTTERSNEPAYNGEIAVIYNDVLDFAVPANAPIVTLNK